MDDSPNPFEAPKLPLAAASDVSCSYEVEVVPQDLAAKRVGLFSIVGLLLLIPLAAASIVALPVLERVFIGGQHPTLRDCWALMPFFVALWICFRFAYRTIGGGAQKARVRLNPSLLGPHSGTIDAEWFTSQSKLGSSRQRISACTFVARRGDVLEVSFDQAKASLAVLPRRCLSPENFKAVRKLFAAAAHESALHRGKVVDRRLLDGEFVPYEKEERGVSFEGTLYTTDAGSLSKQVRIAKLKVLLVLIVWLAFVVAISAPVPDVWPVTAAAGGFVAVILIRRYLRIGALVSRKRTPLLRLRGVVAGERLVLATTHALAEYRLKYFTFLGSQRDVIVLAFPGSTQAQVLLPKHLFENEQQWQLALDSLKSACKSQPIV